MPKRPANRKTAAPSSRGRRPPAGGQPSAQQERFCQEYLVHLRAARAYRAAFPETTAATSYVNGPRLLQKPQIRARIDALMLERSTRVELTQDRILEELKVVALARLDWFEVEPDGTVTTRAGVPDAALGAISSLKRTMVVSKRKSRAVKVEFKLCDKLRALYLCGLHLGMFSQKFQHEVSAKSGVLVLPAELSLEEWLGQAREQQSGLSELIDRTFGLKKQQPGGPATTQEPRRA